MKRALIGVGMIVAVGGAGVLVAGGGEGGPVSGSNAYQRLKALSKMQLPRSERTPGEDRSGSFRASVALEASAAPALPRPVFEDDDLADPSLPSLPSPEDERASGQRGDAANAGVVMPARVPPAPVKVAARPAYARLPDARHSSAAGTRRPNAESGPTIRSPAGHGVPGVDTRPAAAAPLSSAAGMAPFVMAPVEARGVGAANPAHDDPDSVLPPSPP